MWWQESPSHITMAETQQGLWSHPRSPSKPEGQEWWNPSLLLLGAAPSHECSQWRVKVRFHRGHECPCWVSALCCYDVSSRFFSEGSIPFSTLSPCFRQRCLHPSSKEEHMIQPWPNGASSASGHSDLSLNRHLCKSGPWSQWDSILGHSLKLCGRDSFARGC